MTRMGVLISAIRPPISQSCYGVRSSTHMLINEFSMNQVAHSLTLQWMTMQSISRLETGAMTAKQDRVMISACRWDSVL